MPNNVVRSMVLICAIYAIGVSIYIVLYVRFLYFPISIHHRIYARNHNLYIFIYLCVYVLKNISGQYICIYYDREAAYNI